jgi:GNAT superfamily N-acetyltransferase
MTSQLALDRAGLVHVRRAVPADRAALTRMFERCTQETRYRRFHGQVKAIPERYLAEALSGGPFHYALVGCTASVTDADERPGPDPGAPADEIVALASCRLTGEGAAELGLLIEDAWQRHGLGTRLLSDLVAHASRIGLRVLEAQLTADQSWVTSRLRRYGPCRLRSTWDGVLNTTVLLGEGQPAAVRPAIPQIPLSTGIARVRPGSRRQWIVVRVIACTAIHYPGVGRRPAQAGRRQGCCPGKGAAQAATGG